MALVDAGKYGYAKDPMRDYVVSAEAHNTVALLGTAIGPHDVRMVGSQLGRIKTDGDGFIIKGKVDRPGLFAQHRTITYSPGASLSIEDELSSDRELQFVNSFHLEPEVSKSGFDVRLQDGTMVSARIEQNDCPVEAVRASKTPSSAGTASATSRLSRQRWSGPFAGARNA